MPTKSDSSVLREVYFIPSLPFIAMFIGSIFSQIQKKYTHLFYFLFIPLLFIAILNTIQKVFSPDYRYQIAKEEKKVGLLATSTDQNLYLYRWQFYPTLLYYSQKDDLYKIKDLDSLPKNGFLLIPRPLANNLASTKPIFKGQFAVLYELK